MKKYFFTFLYALLAFALSFSFQACDTDPEIITNTIVERDTLFVTQNDTLLITEVDTVVITDTITLTEFISDTLTTFVLVRHAETTGVGSDPDLSAEGMARAEALSRALEAIDLSAVYSTDTKRTQQTATVVGDAQSLPVENYEPFVLNPLVDGVLEDHFNESVLVVGHSNTTPSLLNLLIGESLYSTLPESAYDNLFIVAVAEKGRAKVTHLKFGE